MGLSFPLNPKDVADLLSVTPSFVRKHSLGFGGQKIGGVWRFPPDAVEVYVRSKAQDGSRGPIPIRPHGEGAKTSEPAHLPHQTGSGRGRKVRSNRLPSRAEDPFDLCRHIRDDTQTPKPKAGLDQRT